LSGGRKSGGEPPHSKKGGAALAGRVAPLARGAAAGGSETRPYGSSVLCDALAELFCRGALCDALAELSWRGD